MENEQGTAVDGRDQIVTLTGVVVVAREKWTNVGQLEGKMASLHDYFGQRWRNLAQPLNLTCSTRQTLPQ